MALTLKLGFSLSTGVLDRYLYGGWTSLGRRLSTASFSQEQGGINLAIHRVRGIFNPGLQANSRCSSCTVCTATRGFRTGSCVHNEKSFYDELEIHPQATGREVKEAFYRLSKIHHPDANANNEAALKQFQNISEAYEVLSNPALRGKYDKGVLGRSSSVADREQSSHKFEKESFYGSRSDREKELTGSKELDDWVTTSRKDSFRRLQYSKNQMKGSTSSSTSTNRVRTASNSATRVNRKVDSGLGNVFAILSVFIIVIFLVVR